MITNKDLRPLRTRWSYKLSSIVNKIYKALKIGLKEEQTLTLI